MYRQKSNVIKWNGKAVQCYYDIPWQGENRKYFLAFIKNEVNYNVGEFAILSNNNGDPYSKKICALKCLFEEANEYKAVAVIYAQANEFRNHFYSLGIEYDLYNEVVLGSTEEIINLRNILYKCRVILGDKDDTVHEYIYSSNLSREKYFLCRYKISRNNKLVPIFDDKIKNDITIEETTVKIDTPLKTPSRQIMSAGRSMGAKKNYIEPTENDEVNKSETPQLSQVRRNLNSSFNDSLSQDEKSCLNYSIIEQDNDNLKIKLRVSNGKVLSKIPSSQPVVLINNKIASSPSIKKNLIYELKSPNFRKMLTKSEVSEKKSNMKFSENILSQMVEDMKLKDKTPVKLSPRKLRRLERPLYNENYSDTDSDDFSSKRKMAKNRREKDELSNTPSSVRRSTRVRKCGLSQDFEYLMDVNSEKNNNSPTMQKMEKSNDINDSDDDVPKSLNRNKRKIDNHTTNTPSSKSTKVVHESSDEDEVTNKIKRNKSRSISTNSINEFDESSDSDPNDEVRKPITRNRKKIKNGVRSTASRKPTEEIVEISDSDTNLEVTKPINRNRRKIKKDVTSTPSRKSEEKIIEISDSDKNNEVTKSTDDKKVRDYGFSTPSTRSLKKVKIPRGTPKTPKMDTPSRKSGEKIVEISNSNDEVTISTDNKKVRDYGSTRLLKTVKTPKGTPKTPKMAKGTPLKLLRNGTLTPSVEQRLKVVEKCATPLLQARNTLHVSYVPKLLPCREKEYMDVYNFIEGKLIERCGGCMYISGVPGTGKTATVTAAIEHITKSWKSKGFANFNYVCINGMKVTEPRQCYVEILKQLTGKRVPWEQALSMLEKQFTTKSAKKVVPTVLLIDELDILCTKRQDVVYNLLDWPTKANAQLIVVTIANTMDLPERLLMSRVTSRLGLTRLTFQAYNYKQLQEIVIDRLAGNESFKADAIQFVARKVASVSGDARRALDICRRSAEIAELEGPDTQVSMQHVNSALEAMITQPKVKAILHCSTLEKLLLKAVIAEVERTGLEETVFEDVCTTLNSLATLEGFKMVSLSLVSSAVYRLTSCRLLLSDQNCIGLDQRILLNVSSDDVYYALKKD